MGVSRITCMMIQSNEVEIFDTPDRTECWTKKDGHLHALMLSCPLDKRSELEAFVADIRSEGDKLFQQAGRWGDG